MMEQRWPRYKSLEDEFERALYLPRCRCAIILRLGSGGDAEERVPKDFVPRLQELRVIEYVVTLRPENQLETFGDGLVFLEDGIRVDVMRTVELVPANGRHLVEGRVHESRG